MIVLTAIAHVLAGLVVLYFTGRHRPARCPAWVAQMVGAIIGLTALCIGVIVLADVLFGEHTGPTD